MVYFITDGRYTKVGCGNDPAKRLLELQTGNPLELSLVKTIEGSFEEEKAIHKSLSLYHVRGEWYDFNQFDDCVLGFLLEGDCSSVCKSGSDNNVGSIKVNTELKIKNAINNLINKGDVFLNTKAIHKELEDDLSLHTIRGYMNVFRDEIDTHNRKVFGTDNFMKYKKVLSVHNIKRAINVLNEADERLSRRKVAKETGLHFNTVQNLWDDDEIQEELDKFNEIA